MKPASTASADSPAIETDRPGVAIAVGSSSFEGDAAVRRIFGRWRTHQHIADTQDHCSLRKLFF